MAKMAWRIVIVITVAMTNCNGHTAALYSSCASMTAVLHTHNVKHIKKMYADEHSSNFKTKCTSTIGEEL